MSIIPDHLRAGENFTYKADFTFVPTKTSLAKQTSRKREHLVFKPLALFLLDAH